MDRVRNCKVICKRGGVVHDDSTTVEIFVITTLGAPEMRGEHKRV